MLVRLFVNFQNVLSELVLDENIECFCPKLGVWAIKNIRLISNQHGCLSFKIKTLNILSRHLFNEYLVQTFV